MNLVTIGSLAVSGSSAFNLDEIVGRRLATGSESIAESASGHPDPTFLAVSGVNPAISLTTLEVARALTHIDALSGLAIDSGGSTYTGVNCYLTGYQNAGVRRSGSNHFRFGGIGKALILPRSLAVEQNDHATLEIDLLMYTTDGLTQPFSWSASVALPHTPVVDQLYTLGPGSINGAAVDSLVGWTYDFGLEAIVEKSSGAVYPTFLGIGQRDPKLTVRTKSPVNLQALGIGGAGLAQSSTPSDFFLRRRKPGETVYANNESQHIRLRIPASQGHWTAGEVGESNRQSSETEIVCTLSAGAAAMVGFTLATTIA